MVHLTTLFSKCRNISRRSQSQSFLTELYNLFRRSQAWHGPAKVIITYLCKSPKHSSLPPVPCITVFLLLSLKRPNWRYSPVLVSISLPKLLYSPVYTEYTDCFTLHWLTLTGGGGGVQSVVHNKHLTHNTYDYSDTPIHIFISKFIILQNI